MNISTTNSPQGFRILPPLEYYMIRYRYPGADHARK